MDVSKLNANLDNFLCVYSKLDTCSFSCYLNRSGVRWKPAGIYYGHATEKGATSGTEIAGSLKCEGFIQIYFRINVK